MANPNGPSSGPSPGDARSAIAVGRSGPVGTRQIDRRSASSRTATSSWSSRTTKLSTPSSRKRGGAPTDTSQSSDRVAGPSRMKATSCPTIRASRIAVPASSSPDEVRADVAARKVRGPDAEGTGAVHEPDEPSGRRLHRRHVRRAGDRRARGRAARSRPTRARLRTVTRQARSARGRIRSRSPRRGPASARPRPATRRRAYGVVKLTHAQPTGSVGTEQPQRTGVTTAV